MSDDIPFTEEDPHHRMAREFAAEHSLPDDVVDELSVILRDEWARGFSDGYDAGAGYPESANE